MIQVIQGFFPSHNFLFQILLQKWFFKNYLRSRPRPENTSQKILFLLRFTGFGETVNSACRWNNEIREAFCRILIGLHSLSNRKLSKSEKQGVSEWARRHTATEYWIWWKTFFPAFHMYDRHWTAREFSNLIDQKFQQELTTSVLRKFVGSYVIVGECDSIFFLLDIIFNG